MKYFLLSVMVILFSVSCTKKQPPPPSKAVTEESMEDAEDPASEEKKNKLEDVNPVKTIEGEMATLEKPMPEVKVGEYFYFPREPYRFLITEVDGAGMVTVKLGPKHDVKVGQILMRYPTERIKKNISTLERMENAVAE